MLLTVFNFLTVVARYLDMKGEHSSARLVSLGAAAARTGAKAKEELEAATAKVQQLVDEDRGLTVDEAAELDKSIEEKLARAAAVDLDG